ncbi:MAG: prephenate dehydratase [Alphaproteobacteria bacterium]
MTKNTRKIAFQGMKGAFSDLACRAVYPDMETVPCDTFEDAFNAVREGNVDLAMIPIDNTLAGRVADVHRLMRRGDLFVIGEHFLKVRLHLLGLKGTKKEDIKHVHSHIHAIPQCRNLIKKLGLTAHIHADTAGAAEEVARKGDKEHAAIASELAAKTYDLQILEQDIQDADHNTTRFIILAPEPVIPEHDESGDYLTSLLFEVRNIPAALYKSLGGFATNKLSLAKLESYIDENFQGAQFYCEVEGHPENPAFSIALEELGFYAKDVKFLGTYPAHKFRKTYRKDRNEF